MAKVVILGTGEHGRTLEYNCRAAGHDVLGFLDDGRPAGATVNGIPVIGGFDLIDGDAFGPEVSFHAAIGDSSARIAVNARLRERGRRLQSIIHTKTDVRPECHLGEGLFVGVFALIERKAVIEDFAIVNTKASIGAGAQLMQGASVAPNAVIGPSAAIGEASMIGIRTIVKPGVRIGANCTIGACSLVESDIPDNAVAYGAPCRVVRTEPPAAH